jgi:hypothetical protein
MLAPDNNPPRINRHEAPVVRKTAIPEAIRPDSFVSGLQSTDTTGS